jgi:hypothetical protein
MRDSAGRARQLDDDGAAPDLRHRQRPRGRADDDQGQNKALTLLPFKHRWNFKTDRKKLRDRGKL